MNLKEIPTLLFLFTIIIYAHLIFITIEFIIFFMLIFYYFKFLGMHYLI